MKEGDGSGGRGNGGLSSFLTVVGCRTDYVATHDPRTTHIAKTHIGNDISYVHACFSSTIMLTETIFSELLTIITALEVLILAVMLIFTGN